MSDTQGDQPGSQPDDQNPTTVPGSPDAPSAGVPAPEASTPPALDAMAPSAPDATAPAAPDATAPVAPQPAAPAPPTASAGYPADGARPPYPAHPGAVPGGAYPAARPAHPGAPAYTGAAFGAAAGAPTLGAPAPGETQPTVPLSTGATAVAAAPRPKQKSGAGKVVALLVAAALVGGAAGLGGAYAGVQLAGTSASSENAPVTSGGTVVVNDTSSVNETTGIAAKVMPSVVTISVASGSSGGTGSGVILSEDGYVVTNTHVVTLDGASAEGAITVTTSDGRIFTAEIVGLDPIYDLAVIKLVDASGLTPVEFASSSDLNVGDVTVAIGAPLGLANTVTTGIVSALNRSIEIASSAVPDSGSDSDSDSDSDSGDGQNGPFQFDIPGQQQQSTASESIKISVIQTDAAINPGNSGGALVDSDGKLIGINVAIATAGSTSTDQSGSIGVGFSIPSDIVQRVTDEIIADGAATHGLLGASVQSAGEMEDATIAGAYIAELVPGGAAEAGGLEVGDIVTAFNGVPVSDSVDLTALVRAAAAGSEATVTYVRDGRTETLDVTLGELAQ